jgi:hypothetical protein
MNFEQKIAAFVVGDLKDRDLPGIALSGLEDNFDCESLAILSALSATENVFVLNDYFSKAIKELGLELPDRSKSIKIIIEYYTSEILNGNIDPLIGTTHLMEILDIDELDEESNDLFELYSENELITESINGEYKFLKNNENSQELFLENCKKSILNILEARKKRKNTP